MDSKIKYIMCDVVEDIKNRCDSYVKSTYRSSADKSYTISMLTGIEATVNILWTNELLTYRQCQDLRDYIRKSMQDL